LLVVVSDGKANATMKSSRTIAEARDELAAGYGPTEKFLKPSLYELVHSRALQEALEVAEEIRRSGVRSVVIDTAVSGQKGQMKELCAALGGHYFKMEEFRAEGLVEIVSSSLNRHNTLTF
jgi:Mg-chelatase subunit ChlD